MGMKPTTTERTSPPREHTFLLAADILKRNRPRKQVGRKWKKQKEKAIETELEQEGKKIRSLRTSQTQEQAVFPRIGRLIADACFSYDIPCTCVRVPPWSSRTWPCATKSTCFKNPPQDARN